MAELSQVVGRAFYGTYRNLRPAQIESIKPVLAGSDVLILSGTGSGKTEAALAPLVDRFRIESHQAAGCTLLYVTPTRALANDLFERLEIPLSHLGLTIGIRHGERNNLRRARRPHVLITTPESLDVLLIRSEASLRDVRAVILDEVHLLYNSQRGFQLAILLNRLEQLAGRSMQVVGLSATVADAEDIWRFVRPSASCVVVRDEQTKLLDCQVRIAPTMGDLTRLVRALIGESQTKILIFAKSRIACELVATALQSHAALAEHVFVHYSSLSTDERLRTEQEIKDRPTAICVATSTLELGIDIGDIDIVLLYEHPGSWDAFLQRIGRGSRRSNKSNVVCISPAQSGAQLVDLLAFEALIRQVRSRKIERPKPLDILGALVQQILSVVLQNKGAFLPVAEIFGLVSQWPHLNQDVVQDVIDSLVSSEHLLAHQVRRQVGAGPELYRLQDLRLIWGNFPLSSSLVPVTTNGRKLGELPAANLRRLIPGAVFLFAGQNWAVQSARSDAIDVRPARFAASVDILFGGAQLPLDPTVVEEMLGLLVDGVGDPSMPRTLAMWYRERASGLQPLLGWKKVPSVRDASGYIYLTFAGRQANHVLATFFSLETGGVGEIALRSESPLDFSGIPNDGPNLKSAVVDAMLATSDLTIFQQMLPEHLLRQEMFDQWKKTPVFARTLARLRESTVTEISIDDARLLLK